MTDGALLLAGRLLLALIFLVSAWRQFGRRERVRQGMAGQGMPWPRLALPAGIAIEVAGGAALAAGVAVAWAAAALIVFTLVSTWYYYRDLRDPEGLQHFLKNLAIVGGLLVVAVHGPGPLALGGE
jgi:putative oxidoreductase